MVKLRSILLLPFLLATVGAFAQTPALSKINSNPIIPDLAADPSIVEIDHTFYCYATTDHAKGIYGPGHGSVFTVKGTDQYYFTYLEFGRGSTNRQVWVDQMQFNEDGTIQPIVLTHEGPRPLTTHEKNATQLIPVKQATASSTLAVLQVKPIQDPSLQRTETYLPANALDGSNGTRWMAAAEDTTAWFITDLGAVKKVQRVEAYFVKPAAGHAYRLSYSTDGKSWKTCGGHQDVRIMSPHTDDIAIKARYLKIVFLAGAPGLWELKVY